MKAQIKKQLKNVKQIAETLKTLKDKVKETKLEFSQEQSGIFAVLDLPKFSTKSIRDYFGVSPKEMGISNRWHTKDGISLEDAAFCGNEDNNNSTLETSRESKILDISLVESNLEEFPV